MSKNSLKIKKSNSNNLIRNQVFSEKTINEWINKFIRLPGLNGPQCRIEDDLYRSYVEEENVVMMTLFSVSPEDDENMKFTTMYLKSDGTVSFNQRKDRAPISNLSDFRGDLGEAYALIQDLMVKNGFKIHTKVQ